MIAGAGNAAGPEVSVIIVTWNQRELVSQAVASVRARHAADAVEVVVVDNGSIDGTVAHLRARFPDIVLIELPENHGFGAAHNIGMARARGQFFLIFNSDAEVLDGTIPEMVAEFRRDSAIGCVGARHVNADGSLQRSMNAFPTLLNDTLELTELARLETVQRALRPRFPWFSDHDARIEPDWVNGACMMLRRSAIDQVGGFDEAFFIYVEELDLCYRLRQARWTTVFTPQAKVMHLEGRSLDAFAGIRLHLRFWGHRHFYRKHYRPWRLAVFSALVSGVACVRLGLLCIAWGAERLGAPVSRDWRAAIAQDRGEVPLATLILAWARIMLHRRADPGPLRRWGHDNDSESAA